MTWEDLKEFLDIPATDTVNDVRIQACWDMAVEQMTLALAAAFRVMPQNTRDQCTLKVGKNIYDSKNTPAGNGQFGTFQGVVPARAPRDPMSEVAPIIARYVVRY